MPGSEVRGQSATLLFVPLSCRMVKGLAVEHPSHPSCWESHLHTHQELLTVDLQTCDTAQAIQLLALNEVSVFRTQLGQEQVRLWLMSDPAGGQNPLGQKHHFTLFNLFPSAHFCSWRQNLKPQVGCI